MSAVEIPTDSPDAVDFGCPSWCARWDHHATSEESPIHYSPAFGPFDFQAARGEPFRLFVGEIPDNTDARGLREIAADALEAAEWLEAHK